MRTSKRTETSRTQSKKPKAEGLITMNGPRNTLSTFEIHDELLQQPSGDPQTALKAPNLEDGTRSTLSADERNRRTPSYAPVVTSSEQGVVTDKGGVAVAGMVSRQMVMGRANASPLVPNIPFTCGVHPLHQDIHQMDTTVRVVTGLGSDFASRPVNALQDWCLRRSGSFNMDSDDEIDMEAGAPILVDEDKVEPQAEFGVLSSVTIDTNPVHQPPPFNLTTNVEQTHALNGTGLDFVEDSAMEDVKTMHQMAVAAVQTTTFRNTSFHVFQSTIATDVYALKARVTAHISFPHVLPQERALRNATQAASTSEVGVHKEQQLVVGTVFPTSTTARYYTASRSSPSSSPSSAGSTPASPSTYSIIRERMRVLNDFAGAVDPHLIALPGIQIPLRCVRAPLVP